MERSVSDNDDKPKGKRLFVGVRVSVQTANALAQACETLQRRAKDAKLDFKWVAPANYHVTLKFLGFTREETIGAIRDALENAVRAAEPVKFRTARLGAFPSLEKANILWAGVESERGEGRSGAGPLQNLFERVEKAMAGIGYRAESRAFHAHVSLARLRETRPVKDVVLPLSEQMFSDTRIDGVTLFESEMKSSGSIYRDLHRVGFKTAGFPDLATEKRQTEALELGDETDDGWPRGHSH
jgi:2'-5' RNA ligase